MLENLVNNAEIAKRFEVNRSTVSQWVNRYASFPDPLDTPGLHGVKVWNWLQVEEWHKLHIELLDVRGRAKPTEKRTATRKEREHAEAHAE